MLINLKLSTSTLPISFEEVFWSSIVLDIVIHILLMPCVLVKLRTLNGSKQMIPLIKDQPTPSLTCIRVSNLITVIYDIVWSYESGEEKDTASMLRICILWILPSSLKWKIKLWMDGTSYWNYIIIKSIQINVHPFRNQI